MGQAVIEAGPLPEDALAASQSFLTECVPKVTVAIGTNIDSVAIVMGYAAYNHSGWRRAAARDLARKYAPVRINVIAGDSNGDGAGTMAATLAFLEKAPGITGQYLPLHRSGEDARGHD